MSETNDIMNSPTKYLSPPDGKLWTMGETATFCKIGYFTFTRMVKRGDVPTVWLTKRPRFDPAIIRDWVRKRSTEGRI